MRNIRDFRIRLAAAVLAAAPAVLVPPAQAQLASIPLPLTTNVTVTNPSIPVTGSVNVSNGTLNVHSVDKPALSSFVADLPPYTCGPNGNTFDVDVPGPAQQQVFVLELVNVHFSLPVGTFPQWGVMVSVLGQGQGVTLAIPTTFQGTDGVKNYYVGHESLKAYVFGGRVTFAVPAANEAGHTGVPQSCIDNFTVSGYAVPNS